SLSFREESTVPASRFKFRNINFIKVAIARYLNTQTATIVEE
ncbi:24602_t:CDS:1, partial [Racocetra persica]